MTDEPARHDPDPDGGCIARHGAPAHLVQATVGHASLATTSRYDHARPSDSSSRYLPG